MSELLATLARSITGHWKRSLLIAFAVLAGLVILAGASTEPPADDFGVPGSESERALDLFRAHTPALAGVDSTVVLEAEQGRLTDPAERKAVGQTVDRIRELPSVLTVSDPFARGSPTVSPNRRIAFIDVRYDMEYGDVTPEDAERLERAAAPARGAGIATSFRGPVIDAAAQQEFPIGEVIGVLIAIVLLTLLFRSGVAMVSTLAAALIGVTVGQLLLVILARPLGLPDFAATIAVMLGLGAGIDYALLIIGRFREQAALGDSTRDAAAKAAATAGSAVVAAGLIVMVAIAGLLVVGIPLIGKMGVGAAIGVAAVVVSALTIIPAMIGAFARRLRPRKVIQVKPSEGFARWGAWVTRRPWLAIVGGVAALLVFASPVVDLRLGQPDDGNQPDDTTQRLAYDTLSEGFGPGFNGPFLVAVDTPKGDPETAGQLNRLEDALRGEEGVGVVLPAVPSQDGEMATVTVIPETSPQDEATVDLLDRLRSETIPEALADTPLDAPIGGNAPVFVDFSEKVADRLPIFIAMVIGLSVLLLIVAFRSLWIPLASAVFNLLSVAAAYGVVVAVFQKGIGASLIGVDAGVPIISFVPVIVFAILFGLSMDYNVFLLSRVHEAYEEGDGPRDSVIHGLSRIGKVVLFAGLIMSSVFLAFVSQPDVIAKMFGLGLGVAILVDVLFVRLVIAPAVVYLLGERAWWLPGWLDRLIPSVSLEGHLVENVDPRGPALEGIEGDGEMKAPDPPAPAKPA